MDRIDVAAAAQNFDYLTFLSGSTDVSMGGTQIEGICPLCFHHRQSFYLNPLNGLWVCKYCGESGNAITLLTKVGGFSYDEAIETLTEGLLYTDPSPPEDDKEEGPTKVGLPGDFERLVPPITTGTQRFWRYAKRRHLTPQVIRDYNIGCSRFGRYAGRLIVPVTWHGETVSFVARDISDRRDNKIDTPPGNDQKSYIFNLDHLLPIKRIGLVEGVFDSLVMPKRLGATFGKSISDAQIQLLVDCGVEEIVLIWDEDALKEIMAMSARLFSLFSVQTVELPRGRDPSKLGPELMEEMWRGAHIPTSQDRLLHLLPR